MQGLSDNQLACLFRNNHFNVLLRKGDSLYVLVTDQGYLYEKACLAGLHVWRRVVPFAAQHLC